MLEFIYTIKDVCGIILALTVIVFTVISFLRLKKNKPPKFIRQNLKYLYIIFFLFLFGVMGFILLPAGSDATLFTYAFLTLIVYVLFYIFSKAYRFRSFKYIEQILNFYIYITLIASYHFYVHHSAVFVIGNLAILSIEIILSSLLIYIFLRQKSEINKYYCLFFANIVLSSIIGISYALYFKHIWVHSIIIGRIISIIGFTIPLMILSYKYIKDYLYGKVKFFPFKKEIMYNFKINNDIVALLKYSSLKTDEDVNGIVNKVIDRAIHL